MKMKITLLIIEDQQSTRSLLTHYFSQFFQVIEKESAPAALHWLKQGHRPQMILADIMMPEMTGIEFLNELHTIIEHIPPVIMLSGIENSSEKLKCFQLGASDYVIKPFNPEELRFRINNAIRNHQTVSIY
jgi:DNA-binding response OmpR family regulator